MANTPDRWQALRERLQGAAPLAAQGVGHLYRDCIMALVEDRDAIAALIGERDALAVENKALVKALRMHCMTANFCAQCGYEWIYGDAEQHKSDCLARVRE